MAKSKGKKNEDSSKDIDLIKDVASFASSIGLASANSSLPTSGFDDSDFRKTGTIKKPQISPKPKVPKVSDVENKKSEFEKKKSKNDGKFTNQREFEKKKMNNYNDGKFKDNRPRVPPVSISSKPFDKWKNLPKLPLVKASSLEVWYNDAAELEAKVIGNERKKSEAKNAEEWKSLVAKKKELAERLLAQYTQDFETSRGHSGDIKMLMATQHSGTAVDKVSAFAVLVGENPIANIRSLDALLGMVTSKVGKRHALTGFEALKELFLSSLLPDRKLKSLFQRPLNDLPESKDGYSLLLFWHWEECLKQRYERFVFALEEASRDMLPVLKEKALKTLYALLRSKSEQERRLLSALVNKLGDPENKSASNADYHLSNLLSDHPNMKAVVIDEVDSFLFRPHLGLKSKYHAVNFLSQIRLNHKGDGPKVAKRLVDVYFALFKVLISEAGANSRKDANNKREDNKGNGANNKKQDKKVNGSLKNKTVESPTESTMEMDSRLLSALLTGVNRAFPFVASDEANDVVDVQTPMLFKLVHSTNFNVGVQALMLLDKISLKNHIVRDRFYRALYSKLLLPAAMNSSKAEMFIGLLLRAMKCDENLRRVAAFSKRILQVALQQPPQFACGCLFLLSEVLKAKPSALREMVLQSEAIDDDLEHFEDIVEDTKKEPQTALPKQLGNAVRMNIMESDTDSSQSEDEGDFPASESEDDEFDGGDNMIRGDHLNAPGEFKTAANCGKDEPQLSNQKSSLPGGYDPRHREPSYCNADRASWWELVVLASHVHPSVAKMATTLLKGVEIIYNGNPLNDLSLPAFLDKFMEKKPKATTWHGGSQIEPMKKLDTNNHLLGAEILSLAEEDVAPEDFVFHKFYMNKMNSSKKPKKKKKKKKGAEDEAIEEIFGVDGDDDGDDDGPDEIGGDESDNDEIENMLDSGGVPSETEGEYDYDDLDEMADEDDEGLLGDGSDTDIDLPSDMAEEDDDDDDDSIVEVEDAEDEDDDDDDGGLKKRKKNRKAGGKKAGKSPFASLEDYDHLLNDAEGDTSTRKKKRKSSLLNNDDVEGDKSTGKKKKKKSSLLNDDDVEGDKSTGKKKSSSRKKRKSD